MTAADAPIVVVGAGQAAARAAQALRGAGYGGGLVVVGAEAHRPYERPPLSKAVLCEAQEPALDVLAPAQFEGCGLTFISGARAERLDLAQRTVHLGDGRVLAYRQCLLATGGRARVLAALPPGTPRVHYLRSLDDARRLRSALAPGVRLAVVGGGFLGLEAAASAQALGAQATVVESAPALLSRFLPADASAWLADAARGRGVTLRLGRALREAKVDARGVQLVLDDGAVVQADEVLVAIGLEPETELARAAGLQIDARNGGIAVDAQCRSSDPQVFAAGDCASQFNPHLGLQLRLESWQNANEQARAAAAGMLGLPQPVVPYPWFWTDQGPHNLQMLGLAAPDLAYVRRGDPAANAQALWIGHRAGVPVHGIALNAGGELRALRALFDARTPFDPDAFVAHAGPLRAWVKATQAVAWRFPGGTPMYQSQTVIGITDASKNVPLDGCVWPADALNTIPDWVYTSQPLYDSEMEKIFRGATWNYVALEAEIPNVGDYKRSYVGATPVVVARAEDGSIAVFENRCAHRGAEFCRHNQGNAKEFVCPYHQWSYDLKGNLQGVPFKRGVNKAGGMPKDFRNADHGTRQLRVATRHGVVFASYSDTVEPLEDYLTPEILDEFDTTFTGKKLKVLGYYRNELPCNWKMYHENLKDPYHATLLHSFLVVFGLLVAGNKSTMFADTVHGRHGFMGSAKSEDKYASVSEENKKEMRSFHDGLRLQDERFLDFVREFDSPWSVTMMTVWPNLIVQREMNTLGVRQIIPNGPNSMVMQWTMFGYEDDTPEMQRHRLRQGNLMGPAGFLGLEDNEAMKFVQEGVRRSSTGINHIKLDPGRVGTSESLISEAAIRAMYIYYRQVMGLPVEGGAA